MRCTTYTVIYLTASPAYWPACLVLDYPPSYVSVVAASPSVVVGLGLGIVVAAVAAVTVVAPSLAPSWANPSSFHYRRRHPSACPSSPFDSSELEAY